MVDDLTVSLTRNELKSFPFCEAAPYSVRNKVIECVLQTFFSVEAIPADALSDGKVLALVFSCLREEDVRISNGRAISGVEFGRVDAEFILHSCRRSLLLLVVWSCLPSS